MAEALSLAAKGKGKVAPNPMVGAVLVKGGRIIGRGWHHRYGADHAEVDALKKARAKARGATLYVNLEPCNRQGHVPPCTEAILAAGIKRVVVGARDQHSKGRGGVARLRRAGVKVDVGVLKKECEAFNECFFVYTREKRPHTVVKMAATLDGKIATATGHSKWITGPRARERVHRMRDENDAVMVGIGTVLADDPELTVRHIRTTRQPSPVVLDAMLRIPLKAKLLKTDTPRKFVICSPRAPAAKRRALERLGVTVIAVPARGGNLNLPAVWKALGEHAVSSVLVEGGPHVAWSVVEAGLADQVAIFYAPKILGSDRAPELFRGGAAPRLSDAIGLKDVSMETVGEDFLLIGRPVQKKKK